MPARICKRDKCGAHKRSWEDGYLGGMVLEEMRRLEDEVALLPPAPQPLLQQFTWEDTTSGLP